MFIFNFDKLKKDDSMKTYYEISSIIREQSIILQNLKDSYNVNNYTINAYLLNSIKIGLYNIYDGYLNSEYGSTEMLKYIIFENLLNLQNDNDTTYILFKNIEHTTPENFAEPFINNYLEYIHKLTRFLFTDEYTNAFLSFGTNTHANNIDGNNLPKTSNNVNSLSSSYLLSDGCLINQYTPYTVVNTQYPINMFIIIYYLYKVTKCPKCLSNVATKCS